MGIQHYGLFGDHLPRINRQCLLGIAKFGTPKHCPNYGYLVHYQSFIDELKFPGKIARKPIVTV